MGDGLDRTVQITARCKQHTEQKDAHRTYAPRHLRDTDVTTAVVHLRTLRDIGPRGGHTDTYRDTSYQESSQQHGEVHRQHDDEHTRHIHQQVVGKDELTTELIGQETTDDSTDGGTQRIGTECVQPT